TEDFLGLAVRVGVGGVESGDAGVQGCAHACLGSVFLYLGAVGDPVAVGDLADHETAVAQMSKFHDGHSNGDGHGPAVRRNGIEVNKVCTGVLPRWHDEGPVRTPALLMGFGAWFFERS